MANRTGPLIYGGEPGESWNFSHSPDTPANHTTYYEGLGGGVERYNLQYNAK
jgi:hypothetical protein